MEIVHLLERPEHRAPVARLIHEAFWTHVAGASPERMAARLAEAADPARIPLCRIAVVDGAPVGVVNLVASDDAVRTWTPWLAGMVVAEPWRGRGVGAALVGTLLADARGLAIPRLYLGTDLPAFYARFGAIVHEQVRPDFCFMRIELAG